MNIEKFATLLVKLAGFYASEEFDQSRREEFNALLDEAFYAGYQFLDHTLSELDWYNSDLCQAIADDGDRVKWEDLQHALDELKYMKQVNDRKVANGFNA